MSGYTRQSSSDLVPTAVVRSSPLNAEYNKIRDAFTFDATGVTGHKHDGSSDEGSYVPLIADIDGINKVEIGFNAANSISFFTENGSVSGTTVERIRIEQGYFYPVTDSDIDLGKTDLRFKTIYADDLTLTNNATLGGTLGVTGATTLGTATITSADINGGTLDGAQVGATSPSTVVGTVVTANTGFVGDVTGDVVGNVTGNVTGTITGNITGDVTGDITSSGSSTFNNVTISGTLDMDSGSAATITGLASPSLGSDAATKTYVDTADNLKLDLAGGTMSGAIAMGTSKITGLGDPTLAQDAATKAYVDAEVSSLVDSAPATLDTLNELAAALGDDASFSTTVTNSIATKLPLAGGTMSGAIAMGTSKITGLGDPTLAQDAATKTYVDTADNLKLDLAGGTMSGAIAMGTNKITGLDTPTAGTDATNKTYVDTQRDTRLALAGGTMTGNIVLGANKATSTATPTTDDDLTRKGYVDGILGSATAAATSAANAATSETNAGISETNAANSETNAATSEANALTYSGQAEGHATTAAAEAANALSAVTWQDLAGLTFAFSETIVDATVYDTTQDYDGGAWRFNKKASWYQEDRTTGTYLGEYADETAARAGGGTTGDCYYATGANLFYELSAGTGQTATTRAGSAEFPAVAYITAEAARVIIWDAQTGGMWMVFDAENNAKALSGTGNRTCVAMKNGLMCSGATTYDIQGINFPADWCARSGTVTIYGPYKGNISQRNDSLGYDNSVTGYLADGPIISRAVNDVAITTLPNAPIDPATGLPKSTIAVATDGGVSVIKDDGTVVDLTYSVSSNEAGKVWFTQSGGIAWASRIELGGYVYVYRENTIPSADKSTAPDALYGNFSYIPGASDFTLAGNTNFDALDNFIGSDEGLTHLAENITTPANGMVAYTTSDYSTGWMPGDIKGAWLASTDDTDLVGTELFGTYDFTSGWTTVGSPSPLTSTSFTTSSTGGVQKTSTLTAGVAYQVEINIENTSAVNIYFGNINYQVASGAARTLSFPMVADGTTFYIRNAAAGTTTVNSLSVKLADADRSVNANGLAVNGTVTKTAVATGAELVAYSGFSASNYLEQPYNADLDFGTGDFCVMGWVEYGSGGRLFERINSAGTGNYFRGTAASSVLSFRSYAAAASTVIGTVDINDGKFHHFCYVRSGGVESLYVDGSLDSTISQSADDISANSQTLYVGANSTGSSPFLGSLSLLRISATAPTAEQIRKIYNDEKWMFQEGAQVTLNGSSDAVTALAHDKVTDLLHVGTSGGMSVFDGLVRVSEDATAVTTSISANNSRIVRQ